MTSTHLTIPTANPSQRAFLAVEQLKAAMGELEDLAKSESLTLAPFSHELEELDLRIAMLRPRVKLSKSLVQLSGQFGKVP